MYIGIDVGGTFTDAVLVENGTVLRWAKVPTRKEALLSSILDVLDQVVSKETRHQIERVTLSTTMVTNQIIEGREEGTDIFVITGPGASLSNRFPVEPIYIKGYTDHRGIIVEPSSFTDEDMVSKAIRNGIKHHAAVSAKFSVRNPSEEIRLASWVRKKGYTYVSEGAKLSGSLNFIRRTNSAYFNAAVSQGFIKFREAVIQALKDRHVQAPLYILKADGGSLPMEDMIGRPVETVFTGPAASVLGMEALLPMPEEETVAIDIGGTTTDISLWKLGKPLMARGGVYIKEYPTAVRSFQVVSVGIGGDSLVTVTHEGHLVVGPTRKGPAMALGGPAPTLGDALCVLDNISYGDKKKAYDAIYEVVTLFKQYMTQDRYERFKQEVQELGVKIFGQIFSSLPSEAQQIQPKDMALFIIIKAVATVQKGIEKAINEENKKPIYVVADIVAPKTFIPKKLIAVGGTAHVLAPYIAKGMALELHIPEGAAVANAIGAAVAKSTLEITIRVDTAKKSIVVPELGIKEHAINIRSLEEAIAYGTALLHKEVCRLQMEKGQVELIYGEEFPIIQGWSDEHKLITARLQLQAGVRTYVKA